ncbi:RNA polymerase II transcriptional coactivator KELP-like [Lolium rigidum]|uniref:RNA polymerase II transcriptional coactivator KELP-like n=1 Tax=Lolium rigidum TaxID=89674 RepID=UPI001F5C71DC|nr:RNA polymerase II transcriptional coactivator KELP-like [Lolium rigidum]XP_047060518.1 RNA polymerase II transcriptional coactivator KELP-like [Lolium rigidum]XP_051225619.1 RNA polymerase II transcriptional coactivator KELP [Lolium perenne]
MDEKTQKKVEAAVLEILRGSDMASLTEYKVRSAAADRLGIDLSLPDRKLFVRRLVEDYLQSLADEDEKKQQGGSGEEGDPKKEHRQEEEQKEEKGQEKVEEDEEEEEEEKKVVVGKELDDNGDLILCRLSSNRRVTLSDFKGMTLVSIREYYLKDGKEMPSSKGISMTVEQWEAFHNSVPAIEDAIKDLGGSD